MAELFDAPPQKRENFALDAADLSSDPFYLDRLENDPLAFTEADVLDTLIRIMPPAWAELSIDFEAVELPILMVHGAEDPIALVEDVKAWAAKTGARIEVQPGSKHDVLNDTRHP